MIRRVALVLAFGLVAAHALVADPRHASAAVVAPPLSVADASVVEGTGVGTTTLSFVVSTPMLVPADCGFRAVLTHGTTNNADFTSTAFFDVTAVWDTNDQNIPRPFGIMPDAVFEQNETMTLRIFGDPLHANPCVIGDGLATGTITNDDPPLPPLSVADASVVEGTGVGTTTLNFVVSSPALVSADCGYRAVLTHGTTNNADFTPIPLFDVTAVWDTNDQNIPRSFGITRDGDFEQNETMTLTVFGDPLHPNPCAIGDGVAIGTITNDDPVPPLLSVADVTVAEGTGPGTTSLVFTVSTPALQPRNCGFRAVLTHGTTNNADFVSSPAFFDVTAAFNTTQLTRQVIHSMLRDAVFEQNETMTVTITGDPLHANPCVIGDGVATGTITNDDPVPPLLSVADVTVAEGTGPGTTSLVFAVSTPAPQPFACGFRTVLTPGTTNDADFASTVAFTGAGVFTTTDATSQRSFDVARDSVFELEETATLTITGDPAHPIPCEIGDGVATGTVTNDDPRPPVSVADASVAEGSGAGTTSLVFTVSTPAQQPITCGFRVVVTHGTTNNADFTSTAAFVGTGVLTTADVTSQRSFGVARDAVFEQNETVTMTITGDPAHPNPCEIGDGVATGTITNDDRRRLGHTPGYWRTHVKQWPARYSTRRSLTRAGFVVPKCAGFRSLDLVRPGGTDTLLQALRYQGGSGLNGKGRILLRSAAAGLLNEAKYGPEYTGYPNVKALTTAVNRTLATCNPRAYTALTTKLNRWNLGRP